MSDFHERSPEERERARREREARRAARAKGERPPKPDKAGGGPGGLKLPKLRRERPAEPAERRGDTGPRGPARASGDPQVRGDRRPEAPNGRRAAKREPSPPPPSPGEGPEAPAQPKPRRAGRGGIDLERVRRMTEQRRARASKDETAGARGRRRLGRRAAPAGDREAERPRRRGPLRRLFLGAVLVAAALLVWALASIYQPFKGEGEGRMRVAIPTGAGVGDIADLLDEQGVVSSSSFFEARVTLEGRRGDLKPGNYVLRRDMSYAAAIDALAAGPPKDVVTVTVPEGKSRREVAEIVEQAGIEGDYVKATRSSRRLRPSRYGAEDANSLEGFLFPATYELKRGSTVDDLIEKQIAAFEREFDKVSLRFARSRNLTPYDVLTIASMVEREAMLDKERPLIASVIYNRLRRGEPLGIDATIRFETGNWTKPLTQSELTRDTPYNTRTRAGLPPGPIGSPGLESVRAAAKPADTDYLFYVVKPGTCGEHAFSETLAEFQRDARRYNAERAERGGRSPTDCPE